MVKVLERVEGGISVADMKDGQIGVIVKWDSGAYLGQVVQRVGNILFTLGADEGHTWRIPNNENGRVHWKDCRIEILQTGSTIIV